MSNRICTHRKRCYSTHNDEIAKMENRKWDNHGKTKLRNSPHCHPAPSKLRNCRSRLRHTFSDFRNGGIPFVGLTTISCVLRFSSPNALGHVVVRDRIEDDSILKQAVEELPPVVRRATVDRIVLHALKYNILGSVQSRGYPHFAISDFRNLVFFGSMLILK